MHKLLLFLLALGLSSGMLQAQSNTSKQVRLICNIIDPPTGYDSLRLFIIKGYGAKTVQAAGRGADGTYVFTLPKGAAKTYGVGFYETSIARVVLGDEPEVKLWANANYMDRARTLGSVLNASLERINKRVSKYMDGNWNDPDLVKERNMYVDSLKKTNSPFWRAANILMPPTFKGKDPNRESEYYGLHWFDQVDFTNDRSYDEQPEVFFAFSGYAARIAGMTSEAMMIEWGTAQLKRIPESSGAYRLALGGLVQGFQQRHLGTVFVHFTKMYLDKYTKSSYGEIPALEFEYKKAGTSTPGAPAPDLAGLTPDSTMFSLSQLKGKVVLVDFWASWCGPCRRENPNVRNLYAKYKDQGFDILGVSLDRDANAWRKAISDDQLTWHHISDLKAWQSEHAALYSVSSIPQTVLLDREGKLIARNLRGDLLGSKLAEIFGN